MPRLSSTDSSLIEAAITGLELQRNRIEEHIRQIRAMLGTSVSQGGAAGAAKSPKKPRKLSAAARARIAAAQRKRWAEYHKKKRS
jgi:hypothetical protein